MAKKVFLASLALSALMMADAASAADLPPAPVYKAPSPAVPASPWNGFYAGLGLGSRADRTDTNATSLSFGGKPFSLANLTTSEPLDGIGFRAAPYVGWNWQIAPQWVVGVEGDAGFGNQSTTLPGFPFGPTTLGEGLAFDFQAADGLAVKTTWDASARARLGFLVTPATLVYATGGAAWQHLDVTSTCVSLSCINNGFASPTIVSNSATKVGWTIGGGIERALWGNWLLRGEYRYADFGTSAFTVARSSPNPLLNSTVETFDVALRTHTVSFGVAYKFGDSIASSDPLPLPVKASPAAMSWSGPYLGLGLGSRTSRTDLTTTSLVIGGVPQDLTGVATREPLDGTGFRAAPYVGWNWQVAPQWVAGIEGDFGFASQTTALPGFAFTPGVPFELNPGFVGDSLAVKSSWDAGARVRLGFLATPATLVYLTGGTAWQHFAVTSTCASTGFCEGLELTPAIVTNSATKAGWTIGGGLETALSGNWFARAEYRYADFGSAAFSLGRSALNSVSNVAATFDVALRTHTATFGLAYKFDWGSAPIIAK